ncbi:uncharacterized protein LOC129216226 [Uloborus diversus]|uniref:uncharacterized protein LOC129216226 n=1 Tax=Uloborus diversus TaxID=327109 RepID=UPI00240A62DB|nr:uncharacterized protein LOC129216226 [Uloborus diversus]
MASTSNEPDSPISLSRFNIKTTPPRVQNTYFGKVRAFNTFAKLEWAYLTISLIALTISFGITIQRLTVEDADSSDFTFALLLLLTIGFCYHYVVHSIFTERWDELMVFVACNIIVLIYCVTNFVTGYKLLHDQPTVKLVRLIVVCLLSPFLIVVGILQSYRYCLSNNLVFNTVGGISSLQNACKMYYICSSLLKFDLQLQLSMLLLVLVKGVLNMTLLQKVILGSGVPVTFIFIIIGHLGLRYENKALMAVFFFLGLFEPAYIAYKFYYAAKFEKDDLATYDATYACGYFALVIWVLLIVSAVYFMKYHFGKGLKEKMYGNGQSSQTAAQSEDGVVNEAASVEGRNVTP